MYLAQAEPQAFVTKLGIKPGHSILALNAPDAFLPGLEDGLPSSATWRERAQDGERPDVVLLWPTDMAQVREDMERLRHHIKANGAVWVVIPRKPVARAKGVDLSYDEVVSEALKTGLVDNKTLTFSPEEYGIRFVIRVSERNREGQRP